MSWGGRDGWCGRGSSTRRSAARARERHSGDTAAAGRRPHPGRRTPFTHGAAPPLRPAATLSKWRFGDRRVSRANVPSRSDGANRPGARFGLIAQRESVRLTRGRSLVRSQLGPPSREGPDQENPRQGLFRVRTGFELDPIAPSAAVTPEGGCRRAGPSLCSGRRDVAHDGRVASGGPYRPWADRAATYR